MENFKTGIKTVKSNGYVRTMKAVFNYAMLNAMVEGLAHSSLSHLNVEGLRVTFDTNGNATRIN